MKCKLQLKDRREEFEVLKSVALAMPDPSGTPEFRGDRSAERRIKPEEREPFEQIGCRFVRPTRLKDHPGVVTTVCRDKCGRLMAASRRLTVRLRDRCRKQTAFALFAEHRLQVLQQLKLGRHLYEVRVPQGADLFEVAGALNSHKDCLYAWPEMLEFAGQRGPREPSDPQYGKQWQWPKIGAPKAWDTSTGRGVRIAVIDFGFHLQHPDLQPAVVRAGFFKETGITTPAAFLPGQAAVPPDDHGTACAGMALARADNRTAGCGAAFDADLIAIACLHGGFGSQQSLARALLYAVDPTMENDPYGGGSSSGADVISCSIFPSNTASLHPLLDEALRFAARRGRQARGTPVFYAVDNRPVSVDQDAFASHPAVIAVGSSTRADRQAGSAEGEALDFLAPGQNVYTIKGRRSFGPRRGTSFAAACAAGVAALVLARYPELTPGELRQRLRFTCDKVRVRYGPDGRHRRYGYGRVNAHRAVTAPMELA